MMVIGRGGGGGGVGMDVDIVNDFFLLARFKTV